MSRAEQTRTPTMTPQSDAEEPDITALQVRLAPGGFALVETPPSTDGWGVLNPLLFQSLETQPF